MDVRQEISVFMSQLCREFGICDPLYNLEYFLAQEYYEADSFVKELFLAEGMNRDLHANLFRRAKRKFIERFGCSEIYHLD
jgi:hypothetical protein